MSVPIINKTAKLPPLAFWYIKKSLNYISPLDLQGVEYIVLLNKTAKPHDQAGKLLKEAFEHNFAVNGTYSPRTRNYPSQIALHIRDIYRPIPYRAYFSPMPILLIAQTIAHEVGHHLVRTRGYIFTPDEKYPDYKKNPAYEEEMVNRYAFGVVEAMKKKLVYRFGAYLMKFFSETYYLRAMVRWDARRYEEAAENWYKSFLLNSEQQESIEWYYRSIRKVKEKHDHKS